MLTLAYFLFAWIVSFICSIQPGPVNMMVLSASLQTRYSNAKLIAFGGMFPEILFSFLSWIAAAELMDWTVELRAFGSFLAMLFVAIGLLIYFIKPRVKNLPDKEVTGGIVTGLLIGTFNPQVVLFWIGFLAWLNIQGYTTHQSEALPMISFAIGSGLGGLCMRLTLIYYMQKYTQSVFMHAVRKKGNKIIGTMLVFMGIVQWLIS